MAVDTVLFDLDGTLIDTNELIIASFSHTLEPYFSGRYAREDIVEWIGEPLRDSFTRIDSDRADEMITVYRKHNKENHDRLVQEYEGVFNTVKTLYERGFKLGIVTTKFFRTAEMGLKSARLRPFFEVIVGLDDIKNPKPDPEPVNRALALLDSPPQTSLMVGDSPTDIEAGQNAGTFTAGVAWTIHGTEALQAANPDFMLGSMPDLFDALGVKEA